MFSKQLSQKYNSLHSASLMECISPALGLSAAFTVNPNSAEGGIFCIFPFFFFFEFRDVDDDDDEDIAFIVVE